MASKRRTRGRTFSAAPEGASVELKAVPVCVWGGLFRLSDMKAGLLDVLLDRFADGQPVQNVSEDQRQLQSVISNLSYLFNTRRGSLPHLPGFGLPDITEIYSDIPDSVMKLRKSLREAVEMYEPRLRRVRIEPTTTNPYEMRLVFLVSGEMPDRRQVRFQTTFSSNHSTDVSPWRQ